MGRFICHMVKSTIATIQQSLHPPHIILGLLHTSFIIASCVVKISVVPPSIDPSSTSHLISSSASQFSERSLFLFPPSSFVLLTFLHACVCAIPRHIIPT